MPAHSHRHMLLKDVLRWQCCSVGNAGVLDCGVGYAGVLDCGIANCGEWRRLGEMSEKENYADNNGVEENRGLRSSTQSFVSTDLISSTDTGEITESHPDEESLSISAILHYCKCKILQPYLRILAMMGLRPLPLDPPEPFSCMALLGYFYLVQVLIFVCVGYVLQAMACFRRDRGFCYNLQLAGTSNPHDEHEHICYGSLMFSYVIPSALHLIGFIYTVCLFRWNENEQLKNLMERVFLLSSNRSVGPASQRRLVRTLWVFIGLSIVWMMLSLVTVNVMMARGNIMFQWMEQSSTELKTVMKVLLIVATLWHDMIQATIITSYCLQGQLLTSHLHFLRCKLLQHTIAPLNWIREIGEFRKLLRYFNEDLAPAVCIFTIINMTWAASGIIWLMKLDSVDTDTLPIVGMSVLNVVLWVFIAIAPFVQAARLTNACSAMQSVGHEVRGRPFVYQDTPGEDLDTILLYTSSLRMNAKLYRVPITGRYLCLGLTISAVVVLTLGQCHILHD